MSDYVNLRGHHLLCILTHSGNGYTPEFIANLATQIERINNGAPIKIVSGVDDICSALTKAGSVACDHARICSSGKTILHHDMMALDAVANALEINDLQPDAVIRLSGTEIRHLRGEFAKGTLRKSCQNCPWHDACTEVAARNFPAVKLKPEAVPTSLRPLQPAF